MDALAGKVIDGLSSLALEEFNLLRELRDDKKRMEEIVAAIKATLLDAEANATSHQVNDWLEKLKDVLYDADDLLDDFSTESLARKVMYGDKSAKQVRTFFSKSNQAVYAHKMSRKMKDTKKRLDDIADDKKNLQFVACSPKSPIEVKKQRETYSFVREEEIIGREEEKNDLKKFLLNPDASQDVSIITIVGIGGLGKTALAQLVYNDAAVQNYFEPKMWVCVSDQFSIKEIGQKMSQCGKDANIEEVQEKLRDKIKGRRFLLVLDDVWNEDRNLWLELKSLLREGRKGSMIIVTTRIAKVKKIMKVDFPLDLKGFDDEKSWKLFSQKAFEEGKEPDNLELVAIGKEIAKKCGGIPLALKTIGSLLYTRNLKKSDWLYFKNSELLKIDQENNDILSILKLSYDHLPSSLKNCFTYCSMFPKDYEIKRETLIKLWMAQGFIPLSDQNRCPEDVSNEYFMNLLSRSFFQDVERNELGDIETCKMHDLMHDLATSMSKNECMLIKEGNRENIGDRTRHLSVEVGQEYSWIKSLICSLEACKLRTFLSPGGRRIESIRQSSLKNLALFLSRHRAWIGAEWDRSDTTSLISSLEHIRVLNLQWVDIPTIPNMQKLKHLRYLDLSGNQKLEKLPKCITRLYNLQTLKLNQCWSLRELPRDINQLVSLRHLELDDCLDLRDMPYALGQLTSLQTLTYFVLGPKKSDSSGLSELGGLNDLRGCLSIGGLEHMRSNVDEVGSAKLFMKPHLQVLELYWLDCLIHDMDGKEEDVGKDEMILQGLQPHCSIKSLLIMGFYGKKFPNWIECLSSLQDLRISSCQALTSLPESMRNLHSLRNLRIYDCKALISLSEWIGSLSSLQDLEITGCKALASLPESICKLSSLQVLKIGGCECLTSLPESIGQLPLLQELSISYCDGLTSLPEGIRNLTSLQRLRISCHEQSQLLERCKREEGEDWPKIAHIPNVDLYRDPEEE